MVTWEAHASSMNVSEIKKQLHLVSKEEEGCGRHATNLTGCEFLKILASKRAPKKVFV